MDHTVVLFLIFKEVPIRCPYFPFFFFLKTNILSLCELKDLAVGHTLKMFTSHGGS